jgi:para-nitrobenzyl esterase
MTDRNTTRRTFLNGLAASSAFVATRAHAQVATATTTAPTTNGPVIGLKYGPIHTFKGIRYGAPPVGPLRFAAPQKPAPWTLPADATHFGASSMQLRSGGSAVVYPGIVGVALEQVFSTPDDVQRQNEDCLFLNVWTAALDNAARPVMVWFHGGGFNYGSGSWPAYDGHNLAARHGVVVVTVNHRLNAFGYLELSELGGDPNSGNAGQLDCVAVLEWVRDNIGHFGGNPGNVTIFGQSGGGAKVSTLLAMPAAKGLVHRAIIESGPGLRGSTKEAATETAKAVMAKLGIADAKKLNDVPALALLDAASGLQVQGGIGGLRFSPVVDGVNLPAHPFDPAAPAQSANIPVMIGCTKDEQTLYNVGFPWWGKVTEADALAMLKKNPMLASKADALWAAAKKTFPNDSPSYLYTDILSKTFAFTGSVTLAERKAAQHGAPVYMYIWNWGAPVEHGILRAPHTMEIGFAFDNIDKGPLLFGQSPSTQTLATAASNAWVAFAKTGNPNVKGLPTWPAYDATTRATMTFDTKSVVVNDPYAEFRMLLNG